MHMSSIFQDILCTWVETRGIPPALTCKYNQNIQPTYMHRAVIALAWFAKKKHIRVELMAHKKYT